MQYKKIILTLKSWFITNFESDTVLSYIFWYNFESLKNIFDKFRNNENIPFLITNWFIENKFPRPFYFSSIKNEKKENFFDDIENEKIRKNLKKIDFLPIQKNFFELLFNDEIEKLNEKLKKYLETYKKEENLINNIEYKNSIPRFNKKETNPYFLENVKYTNKNFVIYVKVFDENDFWLFFEKLKNTFENIWFWKAKSRWYWHFKNVELKDLEKNEKEVFDYFDFLEKEKNLKIILNNFKPSKKDLENIDLSNSFYQILSKNTKSLEEFNKNIFKWQMNFIKEGSVLKCKNKLIWDFYKSDNSYNFWYIF